MDVSLVIGERLAELGLEQKDLAAAAKVTESYISQLLTRKKSPPAPDRTDIYEKIEKFLRIPVGKLSKLAELQRKDELKRHFVDPPLPLLRQVRDLTLRKCSPAKEKQIRAIFEKEPFGEFERLITQKLLDVVKKVAREELANENWLHLVARLSGRTYEQTRVVVLEFLDTDVFNVSADNCVSFLDPLVETWDIDLASFGMEIVLNRRLAPGDPHRVEFVEKEYGQPFAEEQGLKDFLGDRSLSSGASEDEVEFLKKLRFKGKRPTSLYYYRELQSLRDPLHFRKSPQAGEKRGA
jgi:transcriptional regulator with XRE-family HTH domain